MKTNLRGVACLPWYLGCLQDVLVVVVVVVFAGLHSDEIKLDL